MNQRPPRLPHHMGQYELARDKERLEAEIEHHRQIIETHMARLAVVMALLGKKEHAPVSRACS